MSEDYESIVDRIIEKVLEYRSCSNFSQDALKSICYRAKDVFYNEPMLLDLEAPVKICGDIHGQFPDLLNIFNTEGYPDTTKYLFTGDYVDRGKQSIQTIILLLSYKIKYPSQIYLLRGNHECSKTNRVYGFYDQCKRKFSVKIWKLFSDVFNSMPICALIDKRIFCVHGGLSPQLYNLCQIQKIQRPVEVPDSGLLCDLLWSDPGESTKEWENNQRGVSYKFSQKAIDNFLKKHDLDLICRAHQVVQEGYQFFHSKKLVTIFSARNYCGEFDNNGAVMKVDKDLKCSFSIFESPKKKKK